MLLVQTDDNSHIQFDATGYTINGSPDNSPALVRNDNRSRIAGGFLTRYADNPVLANGPDAYDGVKVGPRVVSILGQKDYRLQNLGSSSWVKNIGCTTWV